MAEMPRTTKHEPWELMAAFAEAANRAALQANKDATDIDQQIFEATVRRKLQQEGFGHQDRMMQTRRGWELEDDTRDYGRKLEGEKRGQDWWRQQQKEVEERDNRRSAREIREGEDKRESDLKFWQRPDVQQAERERAETERLKRYPPGFGRSGTTRAPKEISQYTDPNILVVPSGAASEVSVGDDYEKHSSRMIDGKAMDIYKKKGTNPVLPPIGTIPGATVSPGTVPSTTVEPPATNTTTTPQPPPPSAEPPRSGKGDSLKRSDLGRSTETASLEDLSDEGDVALPDITVRSSNRGDVDGGTGGRYSVRFNPLAMRNLTPELASLFTKHGERVGVDPRLLAALAYQESGYNPKAVGPNTRYGRARGMMQFIQDTARRFGLRNPHDPEEAVRASADYMAKLGSLFNNNPGLMLASYNWGEGSRRGGGVQGWLERGANPYKVPKETWNYVKSITGLPLDVWLKEREIGNNFVFGGGQSTHAKSVPEEDPYYYIDV